MKIINETLKNRLEQLEKRNDSEKKTMNLLNQNTDKIKSIYIIIYNL